MYMNPFLQVPSYNPTAVPQANLFSQYLGGMFQQPWRIPRVKGRAGADALEMPHGSEVLALDTEEPIIWMIQTDDAGTRTVDALDASVRPSVEEETQNTLETLSMRITKLEEEMKRRHEPDFVDVKFDD